MLLQLGAYWAYIRNLGSYTTEEGIILESNNIITEPSYAWFRLPIISGRILTGYQTEWYISNTDGYDNNDGYTIGTPLKTLYEFFRRIAPNGILTDAGLLNTTINVYLDITDAPTYNLPALIVKTERVKIKFTKYGTASTNNSTITVTQARNDATNAIFKFTGTYTYNVGDIVHDGYDGYAIISNKNGSTMHCGYVFDKSGPSLGTDYTTSTVLTNVPLVNLNIKGPITCLSRQDDVISYPLEFEFMNIYIPEFFTGHALDNVKLNVCKVSNGNVGRLSASCVYFESSTFMNANMGESSYCVLSGVSLHKSNITLSYDILSSGTNSSQWAVTLSEQSVLNITNKVCSDGTPSTVEAAVTFFGGPNSFIHFLNSSKLWGDDNITINVTATGSGGLTGYGLTSLTTTSATNQITVSSGDTYGLMGSTSTGTINNVTAWAAAPFSNKMAINLNKDFILSS